LRISRFENDGRVAAVLLVLIAAATASPFILFPHLPLVDLPVHIARHYIVAAGPDAAVAEFWSYAWKVTANSAVDLLLYVTGYAGDPFVGARVVHVIYVANFLAAAMVFHKAVWGRWSVWPLLCALIVYNGPLRWGFENYIFTLPFALHGAALWLVAERWRLGWRPSRRSRRRCISATRSPSPC
jgi:hypothetical protein